MLDDPNVPREILPTQSFYFLRHGETQFNLERKFQGSIDVPLNQTGVNQARAAAEILSRHPFVRIVSSPANRVLKTASFTAETTGIPMHVDTDLLEFNVGSLEGQDIVATKAAHGLGEDDSFMSILPDDADKWHEFVPRVCEIRQTMDRQVRGRDGAYCSARPRVSGVDRCPCRRTSGQSERRALRIQN